MFKFVVFATIVSLVCGAALPGGEVSPLLPPGLVPLLDGRIVGGQDTTIEEFPHQVSMRYFRSHRCGGSIVSRRTIISAAHCVDQVIRSSVTIRAGTTDKSRLGVDRNVRSIIMHEKYDRNTMDNDIAILTLIMPFRFSPSIQPIALPDGQKILNDGNVAFVSGWGVMHEQGGYSPDILQYVEVAVIDHDECAKAYSNGIIITNKMLCAGNRNGGKDACQGDSGGPLIVMDNKGISVLVGVVSWGYGCARPGHPGVYAKVPALRPWIDDQFRNLKLLD